jgi:ABC-type Zn uptake system ZnuABC Zn-binding protein ZnuA
MERRFISFLLLTAALGIAALVPHTRARMVPPAHSGCAVSVWPLGVIARELSGDAMPISLIVPARADPHQFEPSLRQVSLINRTPLVVSSGLPMDAWISRGCRSVSCLNLVSRGALAPESDPHFWFDFPAVGRLADAITAALRNLDPSREPYFAERNIRFHDELNMVVQEYVDTLAACRNSILVVTHSAFTPLATRFGFTQVSLRGTEEEQEPSLTRMEHIEQLIRSGSVRTLVSDQRVPDALIQKIAERFDLPVIFLDPVETQGTTDSYFALLRYDLGVLRQVLDCQPLPL